MRPHGVARSTDTDTSSRSISSATVAGETPVAWKTLADRLLAYWASCT